MVKRKKKSLREQVRELRFKIFELEQELRMQLYLETMPEYDPSYSYCYTSSNRGINFDEQDMDSWLRAVIKHMSEKPAGHGGACTDARVVTIPHDLNEKQIEMWLEWETAKLRQLAIKKCKAYQAELIRKQKLEK